MGKLQQNHVMFNNFLAGYYTKKIVDNFQYKKYLTQNVRYIFITLKSINKINFKQ